MNQRLFSLRMWRAFVATIITAMAFAMAVPQGAALAADPLPKPDLSSMKLYQNSEKFIISGTIGKSLCDKCRVVIAYFDKMSDASNPDALLPAANYLQDDQINAQGNFEVVVNIPNLENGKQYFVRAYTDETTNWSRSAISEILAITIDNVEPSPPEYGSWRKNGEKVELFWEPLSMADDGSPISYIINGNGSNIAEGVSANSYVVDKPNTDVTYEIFAEDAAGNKSLDSLKIRFHKDAFDFPVPTLIGPKETTVSTSIFQVNGTADKTKCSNCEIAIFVSERNTPNIPSYTWFPRSNWTNNNEFFFDGDLRRIGQYIIVARVVRMQGDNFEVIGLPSETKYVNYADDKPPGDVQLSTSVSGRAITATWTKPTDTDADHILLSIKKNGSNDPEVEHRIYKDVNSQEFPISQEFTNLSPGSYTVKAVVVDQGGNRSTGVTSVATITGVSPSPSPSPSPRPGSGSGSGSGPGPVATPTPTATPAPTNVPAPDPNEVVFYLTKEESEHDGFKRSINLSVDELTVGQDTPVKVRRTGAGNLTVPSGYTAVSDAFRLSSSGKLDKSPLLTLAYRDAGLNGASPERLGIYRQDDADKNVWTYVGGVVNTTSGNISTPITVPGTYAVLLLDKSFQDIAGHWAQNDIEVLVSRHALNGVNEQSFEPERLITRAEAAKLLLEIARKAAGNGMPASKAASPSFTDVPTDAWYHDYVVEAAASGIVLGDASGTFRPEDPITREEFAAMIFRLAQQAVGSASSDALAAFADADSISAWAKDAVAFAAEYGIMQGMSDGTLNPQGQTTRAQAAAIALRTMWQLGLIMANVPSAPGSLDATIYDAKGKEVGWAVLTPDQDGVRLQLKMTGLKPGKHGFHIHEKAFTWLDFKSAGGHYNPDSKQHGHDNPQGHHLGDMPNLEAGADGSATVDTVLKGMSLINNVAGSIIGKSIIIHAAEDDYKSDPAGNAGDRIAGGIINE